MSRSRKRVVLATAALAALAMSVAAYAYWTAGGSGTGSATTGTNANLTVVQTSEVKDMFPGDEPQVLSGNFNNANPGPTYVGTVTASIASVDKAGCTPSDYTLAGAAMGVNKEVPAGDGKGSWGGATIQFNNKTDTNQDACKNATVSLAYTISNP